VDHVNQVWSTDITSDQGSQFTSEKFTGELAAREIAISMDGRGDCMDNIFIERLWRSLKYEEVYLKELRVGDRSAGRDREVLPLPQPGAAAPESRIPDYGGDLGGTRVITMTGQSKRKGALLNSGTPSPNFLRFIAFGPEWLALHWKYSRSPD